MTVFKRRDRLVVFRLTQDEYQRLEEACSSNGPRSLSDFTRAQLLNAAGTGGPAGRIEHRLSTMEKKLSGLQSAVRQIARLLKQTNGTG